MRNTKDWGSPNLMEPFLYVQVDTSIFEYHEFVDGKLANVVEGLELHEQVLSPDEQAMLVTKINNWAELGLAVCLYLRTTPSDLGCLYTVLYTPDTQKKR